MLSEELHDFLACELAALLQAAHNAPDEALPTRLYLPADIDTLDALLRTGTMRAAHSRLSEHAAVTDYGCQLVADWLARRSQVVDDVHDAAFAAELAARLDPRGTHFDVFLARLYRRQPGLAGAVAAEAFAIGLSCAALSCTTDELARGPAMLLLPALYDAAAQKGAVERIYALVFAHFRSAVDRFGMERQEDFMLLCIDIARLELGKVMVRMRDPASRQQEEWIAVALGAHAQRETDVRYDIVDGRYSASVGIDLRVPTGYTRGRLAINQVCVGRSHAVPEITELLRARMMASDVVRAAGQVAIIDSAATDGVHATASAGPAAATAAPR